jgi:hypothetical protein
MRAIVLRGRHGVSGNGRDRQHRERCQRNSQTARSDSSHAFLPIISRSVLAAAIA